MPAKTTNDAKKLALFINDSLEGGSQQGFYLFDAEVTLKTVKENIKNNYHPFTGFFMRGMGSPNKNAIDLYAVMITTNPVGQAWNAKQVVKSAAQKGWGPLIYDIAMSYCDGLIPDRHEVSNKAKNVWKRYMNRSDVTHKKLDDIDNPRTPEKVDDTVMNYSDDLNYAFFLNANSVPETLNLLSNSDAFMQSCIDLGIPYDKITNNFKFAGQQFFSKMLSAA